MTARYMWKGLSADERRLYVRILKPEHSDEVIATFLHTTKGTIVGFRHRELPELTGGAKASRARVEPEYFESLLANTVSLAPDVRTAADTPSEHVTGFCQWPLSSGGSLKNPARCNKPAKDKLCDVHLAIVRKLV